jgi:type I restriction enzyme S subunit
MVALRANAERVYPPFLFALLRSDEVQGQISNMHVGTLIPHFKKGDFDKLLLQIPEEPLQRLIGDFYLRMSERVHILRRANETLEAIARAIFKSWFVDFDPVRVKAEGREPEGMDATTAALFSGEFESSSIGLIPKGWATRGLDKVATFLNGIALQKYPANGDEEWLPAIKIAQLKRGSVEGADKISSSIPQKYLVRDGDLLFSWSGSLEVEIWTGGAGALNQHLFKVSSEAFPQWFVYLWLKTHLNHFKEIAESKVTTMGHIQRHHLSEATVLVPPQDALAKMSELMSPLIEKTVATRLQARTLADLRDTLLPRLISGKLRVPEAEAMLSEVV